MFGIRNLIRLSDPLMVARFDDNGKANVLTGASQWLTPDRVRVILAHFDKNVANALVHVGKAASAAGTETHIRATDQVKTNNQTDTPAGKMEN